MCVLMCVSLSVPLSVSVSVSALWSPVIPLTLHLLSICANNQLSNQLQCVATQ